MKFPALIGGVILVLLLGFTWHAVKGPLVLWGEGGLIPGASFAEKEETLNIQTVIKEVLPVSEYASLVYHYSSVITKKVESFGPFNSKRMLYIMDGTIKLGFDCKNILVEEREDTVVLKMPAVKILSHEQDTANAVVYDESYSLFNGRFSVEEMLRIQAEHKQSEEKKVEADGDLFRQARLSAEQVFRPLLTNLPGIKDHYTLSLEWEGETPDGEAALQ